MSDKLHRKEIELNYKAFKAMLPKLLPEKRGKFALMQAKNIVGIFDTAGDAYFAGKKIYSKRPFSVQEIIDMPADLGFYSHVLPQRHI